MKTALILAGGGAKGAFQVGVISYLEEHVKIDAIYGSSAGAFNALGFARLGADGLENIWDNIKNWHDVLSVNWESFVLKSTGLLNLKPSERIIHTLTRHFNTTRHIPVCVNKVNLETGKVEYAYSDEDDFEESVLASASIPLLVSPRNGYIDGSTRDLAPLRQAILDGADRLIVVLNNPYGPLTEWKLEKKWFKLLDIISRSVDIIMHEVLMNDIRVCKNKNELAKKNTLTCRYRHIELIIIAPERQILTTMEFNRHKIRSAINHGYCCASTILNEGETDGD
jgi:predicted acylesterase/phospholipase RssA